jgi:DNA polymerase III alpha subunit
MVSNHVTFQKRAAVREVAKVMGIPANEISTITKKLTHGYSYTGKPITEHPSLTEHDFPHPWSEILDYANRLEDIPRYMSVHCGGMVITPKPTVNWVPTEMSAKGVRIIQWEKDQTEDSGLVKIDLLGNRSLAVIRDTLSAIEANHGVKLEYATWNPIDDEHTQSLIAKGDTMGVFYVESPATRLLQQKAGVGDYEHLVLHSSMIRPAANEFINLYLNRLKGEPYEPLHPLLGNLLEENYGIMVYQEDVTRVAMKIAGFALAEADELRRIISKKHKHRHLKDLMKLFYQGASEKGVDKVAINNIWEMVMSFAGYSFCKAHSASYALVSFKSAYLRAHYPAEFMAAVISNQGGFYHAFAYVSETKRMGIRVLQPDINQSGVNYIGFTQSPSSSFQRKLESSPNSEIASLRSQRRDAELHPSPPTTGWMRVGLMQIKGLAQSTMLRIVKERKLSPYISLEDCFKRAALSLAEARLLVKAGCFDVLEAGRSRPELLWCNILLDSEKTDITQNDLFHTPLRKHPKPPQYSERKMLEQEIDTLGFLISKHPLEMFRNALKHRPVIQGKNLRHHIGRHVEIAAWLVTGKVVPTKNRESMEFVTFEDTTALVETVLFPKVYARFSHILSYSRPFRIRGLVEESFGAVTLTVEGIGYL